MIQIKGVFQPCGALPPSPRGKTMQKIEIAERMTPIQSRPLSVCSVLARGMTLPGATMTAPMARAHDDPAQTQKNVLHPVEVYCVVIPARTNPRAVPTGAPAPRPANALDLAGPSGNVVPIRPMAAGVTLWGDERAGHQSIALHFISRSLTTFDIP
jgi:hypothetical protein